jgi:hypothetical protein
MGGIDFPTFMGLLVNMKGDESEHCGGQTIDSE